ncbi:MAG TPA: RecX family transcriptional regulator [Vicinamibacterales bacterium]|nr:RecX family transcriptional regulator [Vicinamibacterales bacterium]
MARSRPVGRSPVRGTADAPPEKRDAESARLYLLRQLARRELSEAQARERLQQRQFPEESIEDAITALTAERLLDDARVARARARLELELRGRGPARAILQIEQLGIARETARRAVAEVSESIDTSATLERALARRLRPGQTIPDRATFARLYRFLVGQGFASDNVMGVLRGRMQGHRDE